MSKKKVTFDTEVLLGTAENDKVWAKELLEMFRKDTARRIEAVRNILKEQNPDIDTVRIHFHTIKSSAGSVGAMTLKDFAYRLEEASRNRNIALVLENIDDFEETTKVSIAEFEKTVERIF